MKKSIFLFFAAILCATSAWAAKERVYFVNTPGWTTVRVHAWGGSAAGTTWPGATPTKETSWKWNGKDVYYLEAEEGAYKNCIFNNNSGSQTADLTWKANNVYWFAKTNDKNSGDNKWIPVEVAQANTTGTKIYFVNKQGWSTVKVYAWGLNVSANASWSGTNMTKEAFQLNGYDVYSYTADKEYDFCIFNNGSSQTSDLYWYQGIDKYYYEGEGWMTQEQIGTPKTYKNIKITATVKSETAPTIWWWGAGDKLADAEKTSGVAWPGVAMTKEGDKYVYTFSDVDDSKGVNYLIVSDGIQGYNQHATDDTSVDFINMLPIVAAEGIGGNWGGENKLTPETQDNGYIAKWTTNLTQGDHDIKVTIDKDGTGDKVWYGSNVITISRAENAKVFNEDANKGSDNGKLVADIAGDYTFTYTYKTQTLTVTYPELPTPEYKDITVTVYAKEVPNIWWWNGGDKCADADDAYDWDTAPAMEAVVIDGNTWYQKTFKDVDVALGGIKFKLKSQDQSKESNELQTTEDKCYDARVITAITETLCGQLPTGETPKVTYNVEVPAGTNTCYIAGEMNSWTLTEMTKVDDTHYTITIEGATTAHKYKYASGPDSDWKYVEVKADGSEVSNRTYNANDVVEKWKSVYDPSAPAETKYYIAGTENLTGFNWQVDGLEIKKVGDVYKHTFSELPDGIYEFKITDGTWEHQWNYSNLAANYVGVEQGKDDKGDYNGNIKIVTEEAKNIIVIFDPANNKITLEGWAEAAPAEPAKCYLMGNGDWENGVEMEENPDNANEFMLLCHHITESFKFKYGDTWTDAVDNDGFPGVGWEDEDGDGLYNITLPEGCYSFYFKKDIQKVYIAECTPTTYDVTFEGMVTSQVPRTLGRGYTLLTDGTNSLQIYNESAAWAYGDYTVTGELNGVTVEGTGTWADVDGVETLTATLQACGAIYNVTATVGVATVFTLECYDATYTITDPELNEVTFTGIADGKEFTILVAPDGAGYYSDGEWDGTPILGTTVEFDDSDAPEYYLGGEYIDEAGNTYEVAIFGAPAAEEPEVTEITLTEGDNSDALATEGVVTVTVERVFEKEHLYTIALPFTINNAASVFGIGTVVYNFANLAYDKTNEEYILGFTTVGKIEAGKPYLIEPGQDVSSFVAENVTLSGATSISQKVKVDNVEKTATMTAVLSKTTTGGSYWLAENRYLYNGEVDMPALRALFVLPTTPSGMPARARVAFNENVETGVEDIIATDAPVKVIVNGQLIIIRDGEMYNVQGQLVK